MQLWDYGSGKLIANLEPDTYHSLLYAGKYVTNSHVACGGCDTDLFRVVDMRFYSVSLVAHLIVNKSLRYNVRKKLYDHVTQSIFERIMRIFVGYPYFLQIISCQVLIFFQKN